MQFAIARTSQFPIWSKGEIALGVGSAHSRVELWGENAHLISTPSARQTPYWFCFYVIIL